MLLERTMTDFINELASDSPAPGGGSTAALAGALGAALAAMVCSLTVKSEKYAAAHEEAAELGNTSQELTHVLASYVDEDTQAFNRVMEAYRLPRTTDAEKQSRSEAIQEAVKGATILPMKVAQACHRVMQSAKRALEIGNANAASDAAVAGLMAYAGLQGALYNVKINLAGIKDAAFVAEMSQTCSVLAASAGALNQELRAAADKIIG